MSEAEIVTAQWCEALGVSAAAGAPEVCAAFEKLARQLASIDLAPWPFYAMPTSALPDEFTTASRHTGGWYDDLAYYWIRDYLPNDQGPGPAVIVVDVRTPEDADKLIRGAQAVYAERGEAVSLDELAEFVPPAYSIDRLCRILIHELGHALDALTRGGSVWGCEAVGDGVSRIEAASRQFDCLVADKRQQATEPPPQLECHGLRFTRIMGHLDYRLRAMGVCSDVMDTAGERFNQRPYADCYAALGNEPAKMRGASFRELLAVPMPAEFLAQHDAA